MLEGQAFCNYLIGSDQEEFKALTRQASTLSEWAIVRKRLGQTPPDVSIWMY